MFHKLEAVRGIRHDSNHITEIFKNGATVAHVLVLDSGGGGADERQDSDKHLTGRRRRETRNEKPHMGSCESLNLL